MFHMWMVGLPSDNSDGIITKPTVFTNHAVAKAFCNDDEVVIPVYVLTRTEYDNLKKAANTEDKDGNNN